MASIEIIKQGFYTTVQDQGRLGYGALGIPESGAMDQQALRFSNLLLNNPIQAAALECTLIGPTLVFLKELVFVLTGAHADAHLDGKPVTINQVCTARKNQILTIGKVTHGCRVYLGLDGGIDTPQILGSRSMFYPITPSAVIKNGLKIATCDTNYGSSKGVHIQTNPSDTPYRSHTILASRGPEYELLAPESKQLLAKTQYVITSGNRMGIALSPLLEKHNHKMITGPVLPGTVQLTPSGRLLVLMRDCQTTGGYPRVLQLAPAAINKLAQKTTGNTIRLVLD